MVMKVAHVVSTFPPYKAGIGNTAYQLSWYLQRQGVDVTVFTPTNTQDTSIDSTMPFTIRRLKPFLRFGNASFVPQLAWNLGSFNVVHLHYPFFGGAEIVALRDSMTRLPMVLHYHMDVIGEGMMKPLFNFHTKRVLPYILRRASIVIVTTMDYARQSVIRPFIEEHPDRVIEVPLGVNSEHFKPRHKPRDIIQRLGIQDKKVILFVGALDRAHYFKGINYLIKAFQLISSNDDYRLLIIGSGNLRKTYESIAANFGLERKVLFLGRISDDQLPYYYNCADVFVLPSIDSSEAFGIVLLEAMASGIPVITTDLPGVRTVVKNNVTGSIVKPRHVDALAQRMLHILKNPQIGNAYGQAGRKRAVSDYSWENVASQIKRIYEQYIG